MAEDEKNPVGLTKDAGWQIGVRRTLPLDFQTVWKWITTEDGVNTWLGRGAKIEWLKGAHYQLLDGTVGKVRVYQPFSHFRISRKPEHYPRPAVMQVRVIEKGSKTLIVFHEEHLPGPEERETRRLHYLNVISVLKKHLQ